MPASCPFAALGSRVLGLDIPTPGYPRGSLRTTQSRSARKNNQTKTDKSRTPNYVMAGAYVDRDVRVRGDAALVNLGQPGEERSQYSDLPQPLLVRWLEEVGGGRKRVSVSLFSRGK